MMMKFYFLLTALVIMNGNVIHAQNDANAKKILDNVSAKLKSYKGINATFSYLSKSRSGKVNSNVKGNIVIKGDKYYIKQGKTEIFSNGQKTWNYNGNNEVTVTTIDDDNQTLSPQKLLTNFYDKDFTYKLVSTAGNFNEIEMTPVDKRKNFQKVNIFVDKTKGLITKAKVLDKGSNTIEFTLGNIITNTTIADNTFVFDSKKYKKAIEVIE